MEQFDINDSVLSPDALALFDININAPTSSYREKNRLPIQKNIYALVHACQCRLARSVCCVRICMEMKRMVTHTEKCQRVREGRCRDCKELIETCCYHAKYCRHTKCVVPFCSSIKRKIEHSLDMANKGSCRLSLSVGLRDYYTSKLTIAFIAHDSGHNIAVKNQAKQIERDVYKMAHSRREYYHLIAENVDKIQKSFKQQQQVLQQPTVHQKALRQLMSTLRSPTSHNQQQEMLQILESNPRLMAAFIIYRQINANLDAIASGTKQWHNRVTKYWRPYSTDKLVEDLFPGGDSNNEGVRLFAEAVEENAYLTAKTRGDYYRMFYETINKIKKILAEQSNF